MSLMEGALEDLEQARERLAALEDKVLFSPPVSMFEGHFRAVCRIVQRSHTSIGKRSFTSVDRLIEERKYLQGSIPYSLSVYCDNLTSKATFA